MSRGLFHETDRSKRRKIDKEKKIEKEKRDKADRKNLDEAVQILCTASEKLRSLGFLPFSLEHVIMPKRDASYAKIPLLKRDDQYPHLTLTQWMWRSTTEKYGIKPEAIGKFFEDNNGSICKFTGLDFDGGFNPSYGKYDVIIDNAVYEPRKRKVVAGVINLHVLSEFLSKEGLRRVMLIAHFKEGSGVFHKGFLPKDIFKSIWRFAFVKAFNSYRLIDDVAMKEALKEAIETGTWVSEMGDMGTLQRW